MPVVGVAPERKRRVGGESLLVALRITEDGGLRVVPGITPSLIVTLGPKAKGAVRSSCVVIPQNWGMPPAGEAGIISLFASDVTILIVVTSDHPHL